MSQIRLLQVTSTLSKGIERYVPVYISVTHTTYIICDFSNKENVINKSNDHLMCYRCSAKGGENRRTQVTIV